MQFSPYTAGIIKIQWDKSGVHDSMAEPQRAGGSKQLGKLSRRWPGRLIISILTLIPPTTVADPVHVTRSWGGEKSIWKCGGGEEVGGGGMEGWGVWGGVAGAVGRLLREEDSGSRSGVTDGLWAIGVTSGAVAA